MDHNHENSEIHNYDHEATKDQPDNSHASNYNQHNPNDQDRTVMPADQPPPQPQGNPGRAGGPQQVNFMFQSNNASPNRPMSYFQVQGPPQPNGQSRVVSQSMGQGPVQFPNQQYYQTNTYTNGAHQGWSPDPTKNMGPGSGFSGGPPPVNFPPDNNGYGNNNVNSGYVGPNLGQSNGAAPGIPVLNPSPQPHVMPPPYVTTAGWETDLFACMDDPNNAVITAFCPWITFGQIAEILDNGQTSCATSGMLYGLVAFCFGVPCIMSCSYRTKLRSKFNLIETPAPDWITHCFCEWCALCQEYRELQRRGLDPAIGWQGNVNKVQEGFVQQQVNMVPPMNQRMMH